MTSGISLNGHRYGYGAFPSVTRRAKVPSSAVQIAEEGGLTLPDRLYLVSCVARKRHHATSAKNLYQSTFFKLARAWVEREGAPWYILSAKHGLTNPDAEIGPYDETLNQMGVAKRRAWAARVSNQMDEMLPDAAEVVLFAGQRYREFLVEYLEQRFDSVKVPMEGLRIGQQLRWLKDGRS